ncbi:MAG TPA: protein kinase [Vicinamibacterales bacterium]|nr:protein kinase [Vicinamibacterales bacterium]
MVLSPGSPVGPYQVRAQIGAGGMGEVYRAHDPRLGRDVALKVIRHALVSDDSALDRLLREATLASALNHPNIVTIYETGTIEDDRYIAMELVEGATLRQIAAQGLALGRAIALARQVAEALAVAHAAQIVHRDIKPENVMVRPDGYVKLLDFGLARLHPDALGAGTTGATEAGLVLGTIGYMAPEQARGGKVGTEADVFALGVLLYEIVAGRHPFTGASPLATLHALMWETPEPPSLLNQELPRPMDQLILEMLQKDPRLRPGASEVMYRLTLAHDSTVASVMASVTVAPRRVVNAPNLVGREIELDALHHELQRAHRGKARLVVVSGEAGVGKTTLVEAFARQLEESGDPVRVGRGRCSERLAGSEAYLPMLEVLDSLQRNEQFGSLSRLIRAVAPSWYVQLMPGSNSDSSAARLASETAGGSQERLKREIAGLLEEICRIQPVMLWFDDAHWADPSTTDLLGYLTRRLDTTRVLVVATCRPSALAQARHPFLALKLDLMSRGLCREISPALLDEAAVERYITLQFPEHAFPREFARVIHARTEGNPLFMTDVLRDLRRRQVIRQIEGRWIVAEDLSALQRELPQSVLSLIQRKLDALGEVDRRMLGAASVQGFDFDSAILARVLQLPEEEIEDRLEKLEREHAIVRFVDEHECADRSLTLRYRFAHHVYHNAISDTLRATRRVSLSRSISDALIARLGSEPCDCAADIALLLESARDHIRGAEYWNRAAQAAARLYAHDETVRLARRGLALLRSEPDSPRRAAAELDLQMTLGLAIKTSQGYAIEAVGAAYARAHELCRQVEEPARVVPVLIGLSAHHVVSGEIRTAHAIGEEMLALFTRLGDANLQMIGEWALGAAQFHLGELETSHAHLSRALELYDPTFHRARVWQTGIEPGIFARCELSRTLTLRGFPDQGLACVQQAVAAARALDHPQPLAFALLFEIFVHLARRAPREVQRTYEQLAVVCHSHGIAQEVLWAAPLCGRAFLELGDTARGLRVIEEGLAAHATARSALMRPYYLVLLAGALQRAGKPERAQDALDESARLSADTGQHAYASEHARLQAELLVSVQAPERAEAHYVRALELSRRQGARWLELRAARGYGHFLLTMNRPAEARMLLEPIVGAITEGRDTPDYVYADNLLGTIQ